jgi:hypothetical protein
VHVPIFEIERESRAVPDQQLQYPARPLKRQKRAPSRLDFVFLLPCYKIPVPYKMLLTERLVSNILS